MVDPSEFEKQAMVEGGELGGEYLDYISKTDLATLTAEEWAMFVESVITGYQESMQRQAAASAALHPNPAPPLDQERAAADHSADQEAFQNAQSEYRLVDVSELPCGGEFCQRTEDCTNECGVNAPQPVTPTQRKRVPRLTPIEKAAKAPKKAAVRKPPARATRTVAKPKSRTVAKPARKRSKR